MIHAEIEPLSSLNFERCSMVAFVDVIAERDTGSGCGSGGSSLEVVKLLKSKGLSRLDEPIQLASGAWSSDFFDGKEALAQWQDLKLACVAIRDSVSDAGLAFNAVGGLTMGADALAVGVAAVSDCAWFFVRKAAKNRGTRRRIEGARIGAGDKVLLVDDVVTTGGSIFEAFEVVNETGAQTVAASTLVDRCGLAGPRFAELGVYFLPLATYETLGIDPVIPAH